MTLRHRLTGGRNSIWRKQQALQINGSNCEEMKIMVIKITPKQSKRINAFIRKLCCNYVDGNCLLLDNGEEHSCVQCISRYGIYCNKSYFVPRAKNQRYCPNCAAVQKQKKAAERQRRKRAVQSQAGFRVQL